MSEAVEFGTNMLNELLLPPWTMSDEEKKFESIQEALAFVQVSEMIAGKILSILPPGQKATLSIDKVSTILLQTIPESHKTRYKILRDVHCPIKFYRLRLFSSMIYIDVKLYFDIFRVTS